MFRLLHPLEEGDKVMIRKAQFAHTWYPGTPDRLRADIASYTKVFGSQERALGLIAPHAGMIYSGHVAGAVYGRVEVPERVVVLSVNHRGLGARAAIQGSGFWETPLGRVPVDADLSERLKAQVAFLEEDSLAHSREHSLELHLPFLQYRNEDFRLVPICLQDLGFSECEVLGAGLAKTFRETAEDVLLVASSDMSHFETRQRAWEQDMLAIDKILAVDPRGLYNTVKEKRISMCGVIPVTVLLIACREMGTTSAELVKYSTSAEISGDETSVVAYASILVR
jgi:MEMO1 family protein